MIATATRPSRVAAVAADAVPGVTGVEKTTADGTAVRLVRSTRQGLPTHPLERVAEAYRAMDERRAIKTLPRPDSGGRT